MNGVLNSYKYVKYSNGLEKLREALKEDVSCQELDEETAEAIEAVSGKELNVRPEGGVVNMCKALDDLEKNAKAEGRAEGEAKGIVKGEKNGALTKAKETAKKMLVKGCALEETAELVGYDAETVSGWWKSRQSA